ncbi:MAG: peptidoglycan DD-metalloendopeptidase family protein [Rhodospirillaceae bacterium]|nr:peptidoglycan DD-metalloendopeptidase family protein [Rhodospirillaceae bacterium]MBT5660403.1 peptidoglycan DD-metalloendopeptidase family protein [Rhodospirillaceae bacterium]MBT5752081.1 peptidoglycan DD-metalloendopeptidase family protein [Rhodospirillaceae bacterium]
MGAGAEDGTKSDLRLIERAFEQEKKEQIRLKRQNSDLAREVSGLRKGMIIAARKAQEGEETLSNVEAMLDQLNAQVAEKRKDLSTRRRQMTGTLAALERLALLPPEALIAWRESASDSIRSALLLRTIIPALNTRSRALASDLKSLASLRIEIKTRHDELLETTLNLDEERARLEGLIGRKKALRLKVEKDTQKTAKKMRKLAAEAKNLRELVLGLDEAPLMMVPPKPDERPNGGDPTGEAEPDRKESKTAALSPLGNGGYLPSQLPISRAKGRLLLPVRGKILEKYGDSLDSGLSSKGVRLETRDAARVVAPYDGEVVFAGPFRGYGQLLIIAHGEGYHILLAGISRIDSVVGQRVLAGEPVGVMRKLKDGNPSLYIELRRKGEPINPLPWMVASQKKVSG